MSQFPNPPYGAPYQPPNQGVSPWVGYLIGSLVIGPILAVGIPFLSLAVFASSAYDDDSAFTVAAVVGLVLPFLLPIPLLFKKATRPWGVGILIGVAVTLIVLGGLCAGFIYLLSQESY